MSDLRSLRRLWRYLRPYWRLEALTLLLMMALAGLAIALPLAIQYMIDVLIPRLTASRGPVDLGPVIWFGVFLVAIYLFNVLFSWLRDFLSAKVGAGIVRDLRSQLFLHLERVSLRFHHAGSVGEMMSRLLSDVGRVQDLLTSTLLSFVANVLLLGVILAYLLRVNPVLTTIALAPVPLTIWLSNRFGRRLHHVTREYQESTARLSSRFQEVLSAIATVRAFGQERREAGRVDGELQTLTDWTVRSSVTSSLAANLVHFVNMVGPVIVLAWGTYLVAAGGMKLGALVAFYILLTYLYQPVQDLASINVEFQSAMASVYRVFEYLDLKPDVDEPKHPKPLPAVSGAIELQQVHFRYVPDGFLLDIPELSIRAGETVAVVGHSGSGKTTLINLLLRFFDPQEGHITLDGVDLRELSLTQLRRTVALVEQTPTLFRGTVFDNIAYADPGATVQAVEHAARIANIHDVIAGLSEGYRTMVGERGVTLSGGEKQRICLARALLTDPRVLILDEATSALDSRSEHLIQEALRNVLVDKTAVIIAHRLATVRLADRILVMDAGRIVDSGKHEELLISSGIYGELARKQMVA